MRIKDRVGLGRKGYSGLGWYMVVWAGLDGKICVLDHVEILSFMWLNLPNI